MKAYELLEDSSRWCQGSYALDKNKRTVEACSKEAYSWCMIGALHRCYVDPLPPFLHAEQLLRDRGFQSISFFNDTATHEEVVAFLKEQGI